MIVPLIYSRYSNRKISISVPKGIGKGKITIPELCQKRLLVIISIFFCGLNTQLLVFIPREACIIALKIV